MLGRLCLGIGSIARFLYIKGPQKAEVYNVRYHRFDNDHSKRATAGLSFNAAYPPMLTTLNVTVCYILVLVASISILPRISLVCTCINILSIFLCLYITDNSMYSQLLIIFGFMSVATTAFGFVANKLLREQQMEFNEYASTVDYMLHAFNMSKNELLTLLKLAKSKDNTAVYDKELLAMLDNKTLHNIKNGKPDRAYAGLPT